MIRCKLLFVGAVATLLALAPPTASPHPGGTNADGCHTDHRTGEYHCHRPTYASPSRETYCHVVNGEARCGYALSTCNRLVNTYGGYCKAE
jgi:hypothetical protein